MQVCPLLMNFAAMITFAAWSRSALDSTITGDLPPSSRVTELRFRAAEAMTRLPMAVLPVKKM